MKAKERNEKVLKFREQIDPDLTRSELEDKIMELYSHILKLEYMIENGLGFEDMINDISPMHEI